MLRTGFELAPQSVAGVHGTAKNVLR